MRWNRVVRNVADASNRRGEALGLRWEDVDLDAGTDVLSTTPVAT